jgi:response regulator RpfG family c-di-GMP phosphodiesterase
MAAPSEKILFVDDEPLVLEAYRRQVGRKFQIECAAGGEEALLMLKGQESYAVIVSDMHMLGMDGIQLLTKARELSPDTVRMMLTGADHQTAINAVNEGSVFRYLSKPCPAPTLEAALDAALAQYRMAVAERTLLSTTLTGAVKILTGVLATVRPVAFGRTERVRTTVRRIGKKLLPNQTWRCELSALLSQMGCIGIPEDVLARAYAGRRLEAKDELLYLQHPQAGYELVKNIPRLEEVAQIILQQDKNFDGTGNPDDGVAGEQIPLEARILKVALDFDTLTFGGKSIPNALAEMNNRHGHYDKQVLDVVKRWVAEEAMRNLMTAGAN